MRLRVRVHDDWSSLGYLQYEIQGVKHKQGGDVSCNLYGNIQRFLYVFSFYYYFYDF